MRFRPVHACLAMAAPCLLAARLLAAGEAVIHEFHYKPADDTSLEEFIELHNPGDTALDLGGWRLADAVEFTFPPGTTLAAGAFLVIGENPAVLQAKFGVTALGPWTGKLSADGEEIELRDGTGAIKDRVDYGVGFPWPTAPAGNGNSCELVHPSLDNDLGGSWRASGTTPGSATIYIAPSVSGWKYFKGTADAPTGSDDWRLAGFNDASWPGGQTPIGYGSTVACNTVLGDMRNLYSTVYARKTFTVPAGEIPDNLTLKLRFDDGCIVWLNGHEVFRQGMPEGEVAHDAVATQTVGTATWTTVNLSGIADFLLGGSNVLAIHGANLSVGGSSDFNLDAELSKVAPGTAPTPGAANSVKRSAAQIPPQIRQVGHLPVTPAAGQSVVVTAKLTDPDGMGAVTLSYQTVDPGSYIRLTDPAYATGWTNLPMTDNGTNGDALAGDSIFTATIPANVQTNRRIVRYRITFADSLGNSQTVPYADDEQPNFAYYTYNGLPAWQGAFRPGSTPLRTFAPGLLDDLPVYSLVANGTDVINSQYVSGSDNVRFYGSFVYDGVVYDHIRFKNRGEASTYVSGKNKWRFFFNRARDLPAKNHLGIEHEESWGSLSGNACASPWAAVHRGMAGVDEATSYKLYQLGGLPSPSTHYYHFRVVRGATETPPAGITVNDPIGNADGQYAGDFWGLYLAVEQPDGSFLDERGLPDGNVYKIENNSGDKKHQAPNQPVDSSDWNSFRDAHVGPNPSESWWRANMDMDAYNTFHALNRLTGNVDIRYGFNHYFYHRSSDNRWVPLPWDLDMMFIAKSHQSGIIHAHKSITQHPALMLEYRNRAREILDLLASDATPGGGQFGQVLDEFSSIVNPAGLPLTWADADAAMWNLHPRTKGTDGNASGQTNHRGNFFRTSYADSRIGGGWTRWLRSPGASGTMEHEDSMVFLRDYVTNAWPGGSWTVSNGNQLGYGYQYLASEAADPAIPQTPTLAATGDPAYPVSDLSFSSSPFSDPQGSNTHAKTQWRLAEISPATFEIDPVWTAEFTTDPGGVTIPYGVAVSGKSYRVRVRHQDNSGRWSHWSAPAGFTATAPPPGLLLHYWNFNGSGLLDPAQTIGGASLTASLAGGAAVVASDGQDFTGENARDGDPAGNHLRVNNPLGATLDLALPTSGHEKLVIKYEARRSGQGAGVQQVSYTVDGSNYLPFSTVTVLDAAPVVQILDFRGVSAANNNPLFALRITFQQGDGGTAGNNRFDNLTVEGDPVGLQPGTFASWRAEQFPDPGDFANDAISGPESSAAGDDIPNILRYALGVGPHDPVAHLLPVLGKEGTGFIFHFRYDPALTDLIWRVKASRDLDDWSHVLFDSGTDPVPPLTDGWLPVELPANLDGGLSPDPRIFAQLELMLAPQ